MKPLKFLLRKVSLILLALTLALGGMFAAAPALAAGELTVSIAANPDPITVPGPITLTYTVQNTSADEVTGVVLSPSAGVTNLSPASATIAAGESAAFTASHAVTQAEIDAGTALAFSATAAGTLPDTSAATSNNATANVTINAQAANVTATLTANPTTFTAVGETIALTLSLANSGVQSAAGLAATDTKAGALSLGSTSLGYQGTTTGTVNYTTTAADVTAGAISFSTATTSTTPGVTIAAATAAVTFTAQPAMTLAVAAVPASFTAAGETIALTYTATNTGNVALAGVTVAETKAGVSAPVLDGASTNNPAPGSTSVYTTTYTTTQADVDAGSIAFSSTASSTTSGCNSPTGAAAVTGPTAAPASTVTVSANPATYTAAGQSIALTYTVTNTGNVTLNGLSISEAKAITGLTATAGNAAAPTGTAQFTATYTTTQADVDACSVAFSAVSTSTSPVSTSATPGTATITGPATAASATLTVSVKPSPFNAAGNTLTATYTFTNTGNVTLTALSGPQTAPAIETLAFAPASVAPGQSATAKVTYKATAADVKAGKVAFAATAVGTKPNNGGTYTTAEAAKEVPYERKLSGDATLKMVLAENIPTSKRPGTMDEPKLATIYVANNVKIIDVVDWIPNGPGAWTFFGTTWKTLSHKKLGLAVGKNYMRACVTAENGERLYYRITIWRANSEGEYVEADDYTPVTPTAAPSTDSIVVGNASIPVTVGSDGGAVIPLPSSTLEASTEVVTIDLAQFAGAKHAVLEIPAPWFDANGHTRTFNIQSVGVVEINDYMMEHVLLSKSPVRLIVNKGSLAVTFAQDGRALEWNNYEHPIRIGVPYPLQAGENATDVVLLQNLSANDPQHIVPRCWYKGGMTYGYVYANGVYNALNLAAGPFTDTAGTADDAAIRFVAARGIIAPTGQGIFDPALPVTRAEFIDMLMRAFNITMPGAWLPTPPSDMGEVPEFASQSVLQAVAMGIADLDEAYAFRPQAVATIGGMQTQIRNALQKLNVLNAVIPSTALAYSDTQQIADAAGVPAEVVVTLNLMGTETQAETPATRGDAARLLANMLWFEQK